MARVHHLLYDKEGSIDFMYRRIRNLREDHDLTQTEVAKMLNMSQTGYSKYETGENDIPTSVLTVSYTHLNKCRKSGNLLYADRGI